VVDDEEAFRWLVSAVLEDAGYRCLAAENADEARRTLAAEPVQCVLLDLSLAARSGIDLLRDLHRERPDLPLIVVTGHRGAAREREARAAGASAWVGKPFRASELRAAVQSALHAPG
jgi:DNA-binding NtrC family response regulator